jgi:hypothetical protein
MSTSIITTESGHIGASTYDHPLGPSEHELQPNLQFRQFGGEIALED